MAVVRYTDLVGKPFEHGGEGPDAYSCRGVALEILRRMGRVVDSRAFITPNGRDIWEDVEGPLMPGDLIASRNDKGLHVDIVLDPKRKSALTSCEGIGVCVRNIDSIGGRLGVYRLK